MSDEIAPYRKKAIRHVLGNMFDRLIKYEIEAEEKGDADFLDALKEARVDVGICLAMTGGMGTPK